MRSVLLLAIIVTLAIVLIGCARSKPVTGPDGQEAHHIICTGGFSSFTDCLTKAGEICGPRGYQVLSQEQDYSPYGGMFASGNVFSASYGTKSKREMLIKCY